MTKFRCWLWGTQKSTGIEVTAKSPRLARRKAAVHYSCDPILILVAEIPAKKVKTP